MVKGQAPTLLEADVANQVVDLLNALMNMRINPAGGGKVVIGKDAIVIDIAQAKATAQQGSGGGDGSLAAQVAALTGQVNAIKYSLQNASITATCSPTDSSITVTLVLPNFPP